MNYKQISEALNVREGTNRELLVKKLCATFGKPVSREALVSAVYGKDGSPAALAMVLRGLEAMIVKAKAPFVVERSEEGVTLKAKGRR